ncbi:MAG: prepilin-type N-terminal cleavage/methylation domain-containing protein [Pirellulaceae bacterium]|jgi:prepilin-type N-terminal cleavage/methylation domain-containing protein
MMMSQIHRKSIAQNSRRRAAFTLVEMLMVMAVIALLASATLFSMYSVLESAKHKRTTSQIARLHKILMYRWQSYATRTVRLNPNVAERMTRAELGEQRLFALWEMQRMEMPERKTDIIDGRASWLVSDPALWTSYRRQLLAELGPDWQTLWTAEHQNAECLYLIISNMQIGGKNGLDYFTPAEIHDDDDDGIKEIHDAWENPITFLRWAPGLSMEYTAGGQTSLAGYSTIQFADSDQFHEPLDPMRIRPEAFALFPYVVSAGADGVLDLVNARLDSSGEYLPYHYADPQRATALFTNSAPSNIRNYPYIVSDEMFPFGAVVDANQNGVLENGDNITNHLLGASP